MTRARYYTNKVSTMSFRWRVIVSLHKPVMDIATPIAVKPAHPRPRKSCHWISLRRPPARKSKHSIRTKSSLGQGRREEVLITPFTIHRSCTRRATSSPVEKSLPSSFQGIAAPKEALMIGLGPAWIKFVRASIFLLVLSVVAGLATGLASRGADSGVRYFGHV